MQLTTDVWFLCHSTWDDTNANFHIVTIIDKYFDVNEYLGCTKSHTSKNYCNFCFHGNLSHCILIVRIMPCFYYKGTGIRLTWYILSDTHIQNVPRKAQKSRTCGRALKQKRCRRIVYRSHTIVSSEPLIFGVFEWTK